jgi:hypothetical protein
MPAFFAFLGYMGLTLCMSILDSTCPPTRIRFGTCAGVWGDILPGESSKMAPIASTAFIASSLLRR